MFYLQPQFFLACFPLGPFHPRDRAQKDLCRPFLGFLFGAFKFEPVFRLYFRRPFAVRPPLEFFSPRPTLRDGFFFDFAICIPILLVVVVCSILFSIYREMESALIEIADGNLLAMSALTKMIGEYGEDTMLFTLLPILRRKSIKGKLLGELFKKDCGGNAVLCAVRICPLLCVRKNAKCPTPVCSSPALA